jgi:hypothetical protein
MTMQQGQQQRAVKSSSALDVVNAIPCPRRRMMVFICPNASKPGIQECAKLAIS